MQKILSCIFSVFFLFSNGYSQCCSSGCSMSGTKSFGVNEKNHFQAISFYKHSYSDQYYKEDSPASQFPVLKSSFYDYAGMDLSYGFTSKFTLAAQMGYYLNKTQNYNPEIALPYYQLKGRGLSDLTLSGKYCITSADSVWSIVFNGGIKIPTGTINEFSNDVLLPFEVQSGSGAYAGILGATAMVKPFKRKKFQLILNRKEVKESVNPSGYHKGYQYGFAVTNSVATSVHIYKKSFFLLMVQNENREKDKDINGQYISSSGFIKVSAVPGITDEFGKDWSLGLYFDYPFYQKYNGTQFGNKYAASISITKAFSLRKEKPE